MEKGRGGRCEEPGSRSNAGKKVAEMPKGFEKGVVEIPGNREGAG